MTRGWRFSGCSCKRAPAGVSAGVIGEKLGLPPATLSFHLAHLARSGLASSRQDGRFVIYSADFQNMNGLVGVSDGQLLRRKVVRPGSTPAPQRVTPAEPG